MTLDFQTIPNCSLPFLEHHPTQESTILFIHGALSSPLESSLVSNHLTSYHILAPSLHTTIPSQSNPHKDPTPSAPFTIPALCAQIATLIRSRAKSSRAHIYGHSLGAHLAINLAILHPDVVSTVTASGIALVSRFPWWKRAAMPTVLWTQTVLPRNTLSVARQIQLYNAVMRPASDKLAEEWLAQPPEGDWRTCKEMSVAMAESLHMGALVGVKARVMMVVGTATVGDSIDDLRTVVREIREAGGEASGVEIKGGGHPWILQLPELCARVIVAWIEGSEMPDGATSVE